MNAKLVQQASRLGITIPRYGNRKRLHEACGYKHRGERCGPRTAEYHAWHRDRNYRLAIAAGVKAKRLREPLKRDDRRPHKPTTQELSYLVFGRAYEAPDGTRILDTDAENISRKRAGRKGPEYREEIRPIWDRRQEAINAGVWELVDATALTEQQRLAIRDVQPAERQEGKKTYGGTGTMSQREVDEHHHWARGTAQQALIGAHKKIREEAIRRYGGEAPA